MGRIQTHQIHVETEEDLVTVQIGGEGSVPGGFAKLFNRVIDSEAWARLSDAGRAAYIPLVRFADHRNQYRVQIGLAGLMKYAGLSRSSIKRAIKDLLASKLLVLIEQGGVTADGRNESNLYQLMVPVDHRAMRVVGGNELSLPSPSLSSAPLATSPTQHAGPSQYRATGLAKPHAAGTTPPSDPQGVQPRTPSRTPGEPSPVSPANRLPDPARTATPSHWTDRSGVADGPQLRSISEKKDSSRQPRALPPVVESPANRPTDAAVLLEENGVEGPVARHLAEAFPIQRIFDVVETMQFRRARGKCENPGGFIRDALVKQWQTPRSVIEAREKAEARAKAEAAREQAKRAEQTHVVQADSQQRSIDQVIETLDDDELELLAREVLKKYDGNSAVLLVLTRKPPRECRLMKMEVAAMLGRT